MDSFRYVLFIASMTALGCGDDGGDGEDGGDGDVPSLCAAEGVDFLVVKFSPPLSNDVYSLSVEVPDGSASCAADFNAAGDDQISCNGVLELGISREQFWVSGSPSEVSFVLSSSTDASISGEFTPDYGDRVPDAQDGCGPRNYAEEIVDSGDLGAN